MKILINIVGATLLVLLGFFIYKKKSQANRINDYFCKAVRLYALTDEEDARVAILTAAKVATKKQRVSMVKYLHSMASDIKKVSDKNEKVKAHTDKFADSSIKLAENISSREWTVSDINKQKEELGNINSEYLVALEKADPTVFAKKYPQLFK